MSVIFSKFNVKNILFLPKAMFLVKCKANQRVARNKEKKSTLKLFLENIQAPQELDCLRIIFNNVMLFHF